MKREKEDVEKDDSSSLGERLGSPQDKSYRRGGPSRIVAVRLLTMKPTRSMPVGDVVICSMDNCTDPASSASQQEDQLTGVKATVTGRIEGDSEADTITWISHIWVHDHLLYLCDFPPLTE